MTPIPIYPEQKIIDNSKLTDFKRCPRYFFYKHLLGWSKLPTSHHLLFGQWMHEALGLMIEVKGSGKSYSSALVPATELFFELWQETYGIVPLEEMRMRFKNKHPAKAAEALIAYASAYESDHFTVLAVETANHIDITLPGSSHKRSIYFRIDTILRNHDGKVKIKDFKTSSSLSSAWEAQFNMSSQMHTYGYLLFCLFPEAELGTVEIDGIGFLVKDIKLRRLVLKLSPQRLSIWLHSVNSWLDQLDRELEILADANDSDSVMGAFPLRDGACTDWGAQCEFQTFCMTRANPLRWDCGATPPGYEFKLWNPTTVENRYKEKLDDLTG